MWFTSKKVIRNIILTIIILAIFNSSMYSYFSFFSKVNNTGSSYADAEFAPTALQINLFVPIVIFINCIIVFFGSISVFKYKLSPQNFPRYRVSSSKEIIEDQLNNRDLLEEIDRTQLNHDVSSKLELTITTEDVLKKIDLFQWENETEKFQFINEVLALTPAEREEILDYMKQKSNNENYIK